MKQAVIFTKNPKLYEQAIALSPMACQMVSSAQWKEAVENQPEILLADHSVLEDAPFHFVNDFSLSSGYQPTVILTDTKTLLGILKQGLPKEEEKFLPKIPGKLNKIFDTALLQFNFSPSLKGYCYIKQAFYYQFLNVNELSAVKKDIYESVSLCYGTTIYSVERGIAFAIRKAYQKNAPEFERIFKQVKPPSNMKFLKTFYIYLQQQGDF